MFDKRALQLDIIKKPDATEGSLGVTPNFVDKYKPLAGAFGAVRA